MIFPKSTEVNIKIPKNRFLGKMDAKTKKYLTENIESITVLNKISKDTININPTKNVEEIFLIQIYFKHGLFNFLKLTGVESILRVIDSAIPYAIIFYLNGPDANMDLLTKEKVFGVSYKIKHKNDPDNCKVERIFLKKVNIKHVGSFQDELNAALNSINLELVYEKILKIIAGSKSEMNLPDFVQNSEKKELLERELITLENKVKSEKQAGRQYDYFIELKQKKDELGKLPS